MKSGLSPETRLADTNQLAEALPLEAFAAILRKLNKDDQVCLRLVDGTSTTGMVDLISIHGDVMWLLTPGGRQMFIPDDVNDIVRKAPEPRTHKGAKPC